MFYLWLLCFEKLLISNCFLFTATCRGLAFWCRDVQISTLHSKGISGHHSVEFVCPQYR